MTAATLTRLPLEAGGAVLATTGRAVHFAIAWSFARYMRAPLASTAVLAMTTLGVMATSNALYLQEAPHPSPMFLAPATPALRAMPDDRPIVPARRPDQKLATVSAPVLKPVETVPAPAAQTPEQPIGNSEVFAIQRKLESMKLFSGKVDGFYGPQTAGSIREFERKMGLRVLGELTPSIVKAILEAPLTAAEPEPRPIVAPEPVPVSQPAPLVVPEPVAVTEAEPRALPMPAPLETTIVAPRGEPVAQPAREPVAPAPALTRELPDTPQEAMNIAVETAGDAIDTIINGVQSMAMTTPSRQPESRASTPAPLRFGPSSELAPSVAAVETATPRVTPEVTASVAAIPVAAPAARIETDVRATPQPIPVLDTDAKVEDLMPAFSVTDPVIVEKVQRGLASLGFLHGPIDGVPGEATARAIRTFETFYNYERTGRITPELPDLLVKAGATL